MGLSPNERNGNRESRTSTNHENPQGRSEKHVKESVRYGTPQSRRTGCTFSKLNYTDNKIHTRGRRYGSAGCCERLALLVKGADRRQKGNARGAGNRAFSLRGKRGGFSRAIFRARADEVRTFHPVSWSAVIAPQGEMIRVSAGEELPARECRSLQALARKVRDDGARAKVRAV